MAHLVAQSPAGIAGLTAAVLLLAAPRLVAITLAGLAVLVALPLSDRRQAFALSAARALLRCAENLGKR